MKKDRIFSEKIKGIIEDCRNCYEKVDMVASGYLGYSHSMQDWTIEFQCPKCHEIQSIWMLKYKPLIDEAVKAAENGNV